MLLGLEVALIVFAAAVALPSAFLAFQCFVAALFGRGERTGETSIAPAASSPAPRTVVLIPAHNEESVLAATLASVIPQLARSEDALVVADNCQDATADVARSSGASVVERFSQDRRGKGYALDFGVRSLEADAPDVVIVLDADCRLSPGSVAALRARVVATGRPAQALNLSDGRAADGPTQAVALFGNRVVNLVRPASGEALGMPCRLLGTGMAFPWETLRAAPLANGDLVEDLRLGVDLVVEGARPTFCPAARVTTDLPGSAQSFRSQRTRWEHGHLAAATRQIPRLLGEAIRQRRLDLVWTALDLAVPPLALLVVVSALAWFAVGALYLSAGVGLIAWSLLAIAGFAATGGLFLAWFRFCRDRVPFATLALAPLYVIAKAPIYVAMIHRRQKAWVRTERGNA